MLPRDHAPPPSNSGLGRATTGPAGRQATYFSSTRSDPLSRQGTPLRGRLLTLIALVLAAAFALSASAARADLINLTCNARCSTSRSRRGTMRPPCYELAPGGDFEQPRRGAERRRAAWARKRTVRGDRHARHVVADATGGCIGAVALDVRRRGVSIRPLLRRRNRNRSGKPGGRRRRSQPGLRSPAPAGSRRPSRSRPPPYSRHRPAESRRCRCGSPA